MPSAGKSIVLCLSLLVGEPAGAANAPAPQIAALPAAEPVSVSIPNAITLPEVTVLAPRSFPQPYSDGGGPRASSYSKPRSEHYRPSPGYGANAALHPYTSGLGPRASSNGTVRAEHYEVPPDYDRNMAMHPYTSGLGPCPQGQGKTVCTAMIPPSHYNH